MALDVGPIAVLVGDQGFTAAGEDAVAVGPVHPLRRHHQEVDLEPLPGFASGAGDLPILLGRIGRYAGVHEPAAKHVLRKHAGGQELAVLSRRRGGDQHGSGKLLRRQGEENIGVRDQVWKARHGPTPYTLARPGQPGQASPIGATLKRVGPARSPGRALLAA